MNKTEKILFFRTCPIDQFYCGYNKIKQAYSSYDKIGLVQKSIYDDVEKEYDFEEVLVLDYNGLFNIWKAFMLLFDLRKRQLDCFVIFYAITMRGTYFNIDLLALLSGTKKIICYHADSSFKELNRFIFFKQRVLDKFFLLIKNVIGSMLFYIAFLFIAIFKIIKRGKNEK